MAVPFNDLRRRLAGRESLAVSAMAEIVASGLFIGGPPVAAFEAAFAAWCGVPEAVALANGTDALELALRAVGVGSGDEVIMVANAGGYGTTVAVAIGATPVYVDVVPRTLQMDVAALPAALGPRTRAIIVTHLYGLMNDVAAVRAVLARVGRSDVAVVEDCAQAHGAALGSQRAGAEGDVASFSFYPTKNLGAIGDAGAVVTRSAEVAGRLRQLRQYGWARKYESTLAGGRNSRMDPVQARILTALLPEVAGGNARRRAVCARFAAALPAGWRLVGADEPGFAGHLAVTVAPDGAAREALRRHLADRGIGTDVHYPIVDPDQQAWTGLGRSIGGLTVSRDAVTRILSLPCFPELTGAEVDEICAALTDGPRG